MNTSCNTWTDRLIGKSLQHSFSYFWYYRTVRKSYQIKSWSILICRDLADICNTLYRTGKTGLEAYTKKFSLKLSSCQIEAVVLLQYCSWQQNFQLFSVIVLSTPSSKDFFFLLLLETLVHYGNSSSLAK